MSYLAPASNAVHFEFDSATLIEPSFYAWVRGTVTKYGQPIELRVTAFSVEGTPVALGTTTTDPLTGEYEIDVAPHTGEVMVFVAMDYGAEWAPGMNILHAGKIIHPTTSNRYIYLALGAGVCGSIEPTWPLGGLVDSGNVTFKAYSLFEPLAGGYLKPVIEPK